MVQIRKCRSRKHKIGGCGDPKCPEGLSIKQALNEAITNQDINAYLKTKDITNPKIRTVFSQEGGFVKAYVFDAKTKKQASFKMVPHRPDVRKTLEEIDKTVVPSFPSLAEAKQYITDLYHPYAYASIHEFKDEDYNLRGLLVGHMTVDADVRGLGIGGHIRAILSKFSDENQYAMFGTPTNSGDGSVSAKSDQDEEYKAHCLKHRERLIRFYQRTGYEYNYAFRPYDKVDYWTREPYPQNREYEEQFHPAAKRLLADSGFYVRWPNGEIPKNWKVGARKSRKKTS